LTPTITVAPVRKSVVVKADPARAFDVFTRGFDRWWPRKLPADPGQCAGASSAVEESVIEPFAGGRWYSRCEDGGEVGLGHVLVWEPGSRLVLSWEFDAQWRPDASAPSEVEIRFIADGPNATRVELEHRNLERLGKDGGEKMRRDVDGGWPARLELFARAVDGQSSRPAEQSP
jgi:uncharacterized protein YndB with AHSA1/START domain